MSTSAFRPPPHTYQRDVETVHRLIEDEFFDLESFRNRPESFAKAATYQLYFNLVWPNSHKGYCSPWQIIERLVTTQRNTGSNLPREFILHPKL